MLRDSQFPSYLQEESVILDEIWFRFKEKGRPDDYATALSQRLSSQLPPNLLLCGSLLAFPWSDYPDPEAGEKKVRAYLESFRIQTCRVVLNARADAFGKLDSHKGAQWEVEPWYGTFYRVQKFDLGFMQRVCSVSRLY
jgi:insulysin